MLHALWQTLAEADILMLNHMCVCAHANLLRSKFTWFPLGLCRWHYFPRRNRDDIAHVPGSTFNGIKIPDEGRWHRLLPDGTPKEGTAFHRMYPAGKHGLNLTRRKHQDFPGPVVKNLPDNARDLGSIPGPGRFYMLQGTYTHALQQEKPLQWATQEPQLESGPHDLQVEKTHTERQDLEQPKTDRKHRANPSRGTFRTITGLSSTNVIKNKKSWAAKGD